SGQRVAEARSGRGAEADRRDGGRARRPGALQLHRRPEQRGGGQRRADAAGRAQEPAGRHAGAGPAPAPPPVNQGDYEVAVNNNFNLDPEPRIGLVLQPGNARNYLRYDDPEMTAVMQAGRATQDVEKRKEVYRKFDEIANRDVPWVLLLRSDPNVIWDATKLKD